MFMIDVLHGRHTDRPQWVAIGDDCRFPTMPAALSRASCLCSVYQYRLRCEETGALWALEWKETDATGEEFLPEWVPCEPPTVAESFGR